MRRTLKGLMAGFLVGTVLLFSSSRLYAFGTEFTHSDMTEKAIHVLLSRGLDHDLYQRLGLKEGLKTEVQFFPGVEDGVPDDEIERNNNVVGKTFQRRRPTFFTRPYSLHYLLTSGSEAEDHPTERAQHHFHDPVSNAGLNNNAYGAGTLADFLTLLYPPAKQGEAYRLFCSMAGLCEPSFHLDGTSARDRVQGFTSSAFPGNYFSWPDARTYLYRSLSSATPEDRSHYLAMTFFTLGHVVHLLEDMGVPAHVRNDFLWDHIWSGFLRGHNLEGFLDTPDGVERFFTPGEIATFPRLADFWDNDETQAAPGLAEYVNRNFLSEGTVFQGYSLPQWVRDQVMDVTAEDGQVDRVRYLTGRTTDDLEVTHLAVTGLLYALWNSLGDQRRAAESAYLDPHCYENYARILLPRAISYAAGLIRYFFRGELALVAVAGDGFRVRNLSSEPLSGGRIEIYGDRPDGQRDLLASQELSETALLLPGEESQTMTSQIPVEMPRPVAYAAVYRGRLGEESGAVIGTTVRPFIVFATTRNGADEIFLMNPDGGGVHPLIVNADPTVSYGHPEVSPDGTKIAFQSNSGGEDGIFLKDLLTGEVKKLCRGYWPSWSSDSRLLVFQRLSGEQMHDLFTIDIQNLTETRLTLGTSDNLYPAWSPDGSRIAYSSLRNGWYRVVLMDPQGSELATVTGGSRDAFKPSWSPDGKHIAFERPSKGVYQVGEPVFLNVHRIDLETGAEINLTGMDGTTRNRSAWAGSPTWTPDGQEILMEFWESDAPGSDLWVLDAATGAFLRNLTADSPADDGYPAYGMGWP